jgi:hypothetical protein
MELGKYKMVIWKGFPYDENTFSYAAMNGSLENMKWLLENKFSYDTYAISLTVRNGTMKNMDGY